MAKFRVYSQILTELNSIMVLDLITRDVVDHYICALIVNILKDLSLTIDVNEIVV